jgi:pimeloyl-ACP methyl ester carboxylesterase
MARSALINLGDGFAARVIPGDGDVTFWIPGYTLDSTCWSELWERLPDWTRLSVDLPGHGSSLPLDGAEELSALARRIGALAIARKARHLVGLSLGTVLALQIALEYPGAFATLTLGGPMLGGGPFDPDIRIRYQEVKKLFGESGHGRHLRERWMGPGASLFRGVERRPQLRERLERQVGRHPWWELADDAYVRLWQTPQMLKDLGGVTAATLLLVGAGDSGAVKQCADFLERLIPGCRRSDLAGVGHLCLLEEPAGVQLILEEHWRAHPASAHLLEDHLENHAAHN